MKPRNIMLYADSGDTKSTQCFNLAKWIHQNTGLKGRFIGANASDLASFEDSGMIDKGIIDYFDIASIEHPLAALRWLSQGYWPRNLRNKQTQEIVKYFAKDSKCKQDGSFANVGFYIIEGMTGISTLLLNHIRGQDEGVGFKHSFKYEEEGEIIGGLQEGHYGLVQQELYKMVVQGFACLPVKYVIWTALIGKGVDKRVNETIYGPKSAGQATTFEIPSWFDDCLHLDRIKEQRAGTEGKGAGDNNENLVEKVVAWYMKHNDADTDIPYLAKVRILSELYPKLVEKFPKGYVTLGFKTGLEKLYQVREDLVKGYQEGQAQATVQVQTTQTAKGGE